MIDLNDISIEDLKAVGKHVRNLGDRQKELRLKPTGKQKAACWRAMLKAQQEFSRTGHATIGEDDEQS